MKFSLYYAPNVPRSQDTLIKYIYLCYLCLKIGVYREGGVQISIVTIGLGAGYVFDSLADPLLQFNDVANDDSNFLKEMNNENEYDCNAFIVPQSG